MAARHTLPLFFASLGPAVPLSAQCPPVSTHVGFHQQHVGAALVAVGDEALFGARQALSCEVFQRAPDDVWARSAIIQSLGSPVSYGQALDLQGSTAVLGDSGDSTFPTTAFHGAVGVAQKFAGVWSVVDWILPPAPVLGGWFGSAVALSEDATMLLVGAPREKGWGVAHLFTNDGTGWVLAASLEPTGALVGDNFGKALDIVDGRLIVGAPDHAGTGAVFVFEQTDGGWSETAKLIPADAITGDMFGSKVVGRGERLFASAPRHPVGANVGAGAVYEFEALAAAWVEIGSIEKDEPRFQFGRALDLDGDFLAIGGSGYAYVYRQEPAGWRPLAEFTYPDAVTFSDFGASVALYSKGLLVGAPQYDDNGFNYPDGMGAVHSYDLTDYGQEFIACGHSVPISGGSEHLLLDSPSHANDGFIVLGSMSGTGPTVVRGLAVPLSSDAYFKFTLRMPNSVALPGGFGVLDANGQAEADFVLPPGQSPTLAGLTLQHAFVTFGPGGSNAEVSNPVAVNLIP